MIALQFILFSKTIFHILIFRRFTCLIEGEHFNILEISFDKSISRRIKRLRLNINKSLWSLKNTAACTSDTGTRESHLRATSSFFHSKTWAPPLRITRIGGFDLMTICNNDTASRLSLADSLINSIGNAFHASVHIAIVCSRDVATNRRSARYQIRASWWPIHQFGNSPRVK